MAEVAAGRRMLGEIEETSLDEVRYHNSLHKSPLAV